MEIDNPVRITTYYLSQQRDKMFFCDLFNCTCYLPLYYLINGIYMIDPFLSISIPLMHSIYPSACACLPVRVRTQTGKYPGLPSGSGLHLSPMAVALVFLVPG